MHQPDNTTKDEYHPAAYSRLLWLSLVLVFPALIHGLNLNLPTVALPLLDLSIDTASWMGSIGIYMSPVGSLLSGVVIDKFGRKAALIFGIVPSFIGWSLLYWNYNETVLLLGQTINGISIGSLLYPIHVYAGECILTQNVRLRNNFMICVGFFSSLGTVVVIFFSTFLDYSHICAVALATVAVITVTFCIVIPESPTWLYLQGRQGDAEWSEKRLSITQPILHKATHTKEELEPTNWSWKSISQSLEKLKRPDVYKPLYLCSLAQALIPASGVTTVIMYQINIIGDTIPGQAVHNATELTHSVNAQELSLFCSVFTIVGCLLSTFVLEMGLKKLFIATNVLVAFDLAILTYCALDGAVGVLQLRVASIAMMAFLSGSFIGPWSTAGADMFPADCKGFFSIPLTIGSISCATANKVFPYLYLHFGGYAYCIYAFIDVVGIIYLYTLFPEVVGKTLDQINEGFMGKKQDQQ